MDVRRADDVALDVGIGHQTMLFVCLSQVSAEKYHRGIPWSVFL